MASSLQTSSNEEIKYLRFLNNTLQIRELRKDICDQFTRKIFDYLEVEPLFDAQVFCAFLYKFIHKCQLYKNLFMTRQDNIYDKIRLENGRIENELYSFLDSPTIKFVLSLVDPNQFPNISIEEKLKHLIPNNDKAENADLDSQALLAKLSRKNNPSWKKAIVKIIVPKIGGNAKIVPYFDLEFILRRLSTEQKLDVLHFTICALNFLSQKDEPVETYSNREISDAVYVSKPEHLKFISDKLIILRDIIILNAFRDKESDDEIFNEIEFSQDAPDVARILQAQNQDPQIEKRWANKNSLTVSKPEPEFIREWRLKRIRRPFNFPESDLWQPIEIGAIEEHSGLAKPESKVGEEKEKKIKSYPPHFLQQIIDTAVRLYEEKDKVKAIDIYTELHIEKNTYNKRIKFFGYDTPMILDKAREIVREKKRDKT